MSAVGMSRFGRVAVLMGGWSAEREISLKSGTAVCQALQGAGVDAHPLDVGRDVIHVLETGGYDRAFVVLHGRGGEDGVIQGALELLGLPYTGSGVMASAIGMDKWRTRLIWQAAGLPVPLTERVTADSDFDAIEGRLGLPLFVKPANEGSSIGISKVKQRGGLRAAWETAVQYDPLVLAENCLDGGEYTVSILRGHALPVIRIVPATEFYDYDAKYFRDDTRYLCPCGLADEDEQAMQALALEAFSLLGCRGWGRVDFLLDGQGRPYLLEVNTVPGMTDHSLVPMAARAAGMSFEQLVLAILEDSLTSAEVQ
ncbi:MAG: D-alanine--D-alanine ligase [Chromatiales bacterium]|nr:D-alanine--D-alanine ligase [Chromatiales bacterium]MDX9767210.1 D-alanine--D-alanine ligase [Ectothiorhodospiraceae bacterium]